MRHGGLVLVTIAALLGCGGGAAQSAPVRPSAEVSDPGANANHHAAADEVVDVDGDPDAGVGTAVANEILVTGRGFMPQPAVRTGTAGSVDTSTARDGSSLDPSCIGTFPSSPQHVIKLGGAIDVLRVLVDTDSNDLTLAVHTPDGVWHCNDDSGDPLNSLNPTVELYSPTAGEIEVWVGTYSSYYAGAPYRLGVTEQPGYASDILRH